jgi:DNA-binding NarL/FixJ family response regulator
VKVRVLLADDHLPFRKALRLLLEDTPDIEIVAEAVDGPGVIECARQTPLDVVCMDINMPHLDGIEATRQLLFIQPGVKIIGLSAHIDPARVSAMIDAGASAYVVKLRAGKELVQAIHQVCRNETWFSPELAWAWAAPPG